MMDGVDKAILAELQNNFPLEERPYDVIAKRLTITVEELWARINHLIEGGVIRRVGASINSHKFGYQSTLAAISVGKDSIDRATELMAKFPEITHSYLRNHHFNIWFTVIASDMGRVKYVLEAIRYGLGLAESDLLNLPVKRQFKLDARF